jgi:hypothetical protein
MIGGDGVDSVDHLYFFSYRIKTYWTRMWSLTMGISVRTVGLALGLNDE